MRIRTIENPIIRDTVTFLKTSAETGGEYSEVVIEIHPGGGNEPHYHTSFTESFTALKGQLGVLAGSKRRLLSPGESATVPPRMVHCFFNPSSRVAKFKERRDLATRASSSSRKSPMDWHGMDT